MTLVKVCGIRSVAEGRVALEAGADWLGFIFWRPGKRYIAPADAAEIIAALRRESLAWSAVGVFVDPPLQDVQHAADLCGLDYIQLSGDEPADFRRRDAPELHQHRQDERQRQRVERIEERRTANDDPRADVPARERDALEPRDETWRLELAHVRLRGGFGGQVSAARGVHAAPR